MRRDVLAVIEAAYEPAASPEAWLQGLATVAAPLLDRGLGTYFSFYDAPADGMPSMRHPIVLADGRIAEVMPEVTASLFAAMDGGHEGRTLMRRLLPLAPAAGSALTLAQGSLTADLFLRLWRADAGRRTGDAFGVLGGDPSGHGVILSGMLPEGHRVPPREQQMWLRVAVHLASAHRLVRHATPEVDAVLRPDGRVEHAEPAAQSSASLAALRDETKSMDRARGRLRRADPETALEVWRGLVAGQWSLVDQIDTDGRRYIFARRNAPEVRPWKNLSDRERQVLAYASEGQSHKIIAYELGIGVSTVGTHLRSAARKIGVSSRLALVRAYQAQAGARP